MIITKILVFKLPRFFANPFTMHRPIFHIVLSSFDKQMGVGHCRIACMKCMITCYKQGMCWALCRTNSAWPMEDAVVCASGVSIAEGIQPELLVICWHDIDMPGQTPCWLESHYMEKSAIKRSQVPRDNWAKISNGHLLFLLMVKMQTHSLQLIQSWWGKWSSWELSFLSQVCSC